MSLQDLAAIASIVSSVAVAASLIFVGLQVSQQNQQMKMSRLAVLASMEGAGAELGQNTFLVLASDETLLDIVRRGSRNPTELTLPEQGRFSAYMMSNFYHIQVGYLSYLDGVSTDERWQSHAGVTAPLLRHPGGRGWWERNRTLFTPRYRAWVDGLAGIGPLMPPGLPEGHPLSASPAPAPDAHLA